MAFCVRIVVFVLSIMVISSNIFGDEELRLLDSINYDGKITYKVYSKINCKCPLIIKMFVGENEIFTLKETGIKSPGGKIKETDDGWFIYPMEQGKSLPVFVRVNRLQVGENTSGVLLTYERVSPKGDLFFAVHRAFLFDGKKINKILDCIDDGKAHSSTVDNYDIDGDSIDELLIKGKAFSCNESVQFHSGDVFYKWHKTRYVKATKENMNGVTTFPKIRSYKYNQDNCKKRAFYDSRKFSKGDIKNGAKFFLLNNAITIITQTFPKVSKKICLDLKKRNKILVSKLSRMKVPKVSKGIKNRYLNDLKFSAWLSESKCNFFLTKDVEILKKKYKNIDPNIMCAPAVREIEEKTSATGKIFSTISLNMFSHSLQDLVYKKWSICVGAYWKSMSYWTSKKAWKSMIIKEEKVKCK